MHAVRRLLFVATIAILASSSLVRAAEPAADEDGVRAAMGRFLTALNALDLDGMVALFASDVTAFVPSAQAERVVGREALAAVFRDFVDALAPKTARLNIVPEDMLVRVDGDTGVVAFQVRGASVVNRRSFVFRRTEGRWLIVHFHASDAPSSPARR